MLLLLAALPWLALHHALNYSIGGTFAPANAITAYLEYPGSAFNAQNMTGHWQHRSLWDFAVYAVALLFGKRGFFGHNLPLFLTIIGGGILMRRRNLAERVELIWAVGWSLATWLLYATTSNNYSGVCASIRWFVPLLAPAYLLLALLLREYPEKRFDLILLSTWGAILAAIMWWQGPWLNRMVPFFWPIQAVALLSWIFCARWRQRTAENRRDTKTQSN
jgi:hypothetical protein